MKLLVRTSVAIVVAATILVAGVTACANRSNGRYYALAAALTKLSRVVETYVTYEDVPQDITEEELLSRATADDLGLLKPFERYNVHVKRQEHHVLLLVCSKDNMKGLLEDAGCTAAMDRHLWQQKPQAPCEFTMDITVLCSESSDI